MTSFLLKIFICLVGAGLTLYATVNEQNQLMILRRAIPPRAKELKALQEENHRLKYVIDRFESPLHLIELSRKPEYGHLKYPKAGDIVILPVSDANER
ncbi:MAG: hypothetical protein E6Q59_00405 [Nitrosomonas sp.]|nr:MAG: hypothetical protein E6Q59_00405 [Nitrosomonas sp.]